MTERSISHGTFVVERSYPVPPSRVFAAWADPRLKAKWFASPDDANSKQAFDFRVGGRESSEGEIGEGQVYRFDATYQDIVPDNRIVYTYDMHLNDQRISVSLATIELKPEGNGTRMTVTEHGAFLDGLDNVAQREQGTNELMDALGRSLEQTAGASA